MKGINAYAVISVIKGPFSCIEDGKRVSYEDSKIAEDKYTSYDRVLSMSVENNEIVLNIENVEEQEHERSREAQAKFIREHKARFGVEPNLFDGA